MYVLIAIFINLGGTSSHLYQAASATSLGEYSSLNTCQTVAAAVRAEADKYKNADYGMRFVCAKK